MGLRRVWIVVTAASLMMPVRQAAGEAGGSIPPRFIAGLIGAGGGHTCVVVNATFADWQALCWGAAGSGQLGYGNTDVVGDDEEPQDYGPVIFGGGRTARAITTGLSHTCALLDDGTVRCWGVGTLGRLGYGDTATIGDDETPASVGPVALGAGRTAVAISAGWEHTCALLDNGRVRCWGSGERGQLGYGNTNDIGDDETPGSVTPVSLGLGARAVAITAGAYHSCALLDDGKVRCWGYGQYGRLGYGNTSTIGDGETPDSVQPVRLGKGRTAIAIEAGWGHTCAVLDNGKVRCWGYNGVGQLGLGTMSDVGDDEHPSSVGTVKLGADRTAVAITAGWTHTCAVLDDGAVRCWGLSSSGQLGYGNTTTIGDDETPDTVGPVDLGTGRTAKAITAGSAHTCALLDDGSVICWGSGGSGRLGYGNTTTIGDDETPGSMGPVNLGGEMFVRGTPELTLTVNPSVDTDPPVRFRASGRLRLPTGPPVEEACMGIVRVTVKRGGEVIRRSDAPLSLVEGRCRYGTRFSFKAAVIGNANSLKVGARFLGNELLGSAISPVSTVTV